MIFREILVEILSTFTIVFLTAYARVAADLQSGSDKMQIGLVSCVTTAVFVLLCFPKAHCHFNPILTMADIFFKDLSVVSGIVIMLSQLVGSLTAFACVVMTLTDQQNEDLADKSVIGFSSMNPKFSIVNGFYSELIFSAFVVYICLEFSDMKRKGQYWIEYYALVRGVVMLLASIACESISGWDFNPFAVLSAALMSTKLESYQWIYFISPVIGASIGGLIYNKKMVSKFYNSMKNELE